MKRLLLVLPILATACANPQPINNNPNPIPDVINNVVTPSNQAQLKTNFTEAAFNFDQAMAIGILPPNSPIDLCQHEINQLLGIEAPPGAPAVQQFTPEETSIGGVGSALIVELVKLQSLSQGGVTLPPDCVYLAGQLQMMAAGKLFGVNVNVGTLGGGLPTSVSKVNAARKPGGKP